MKFKFSFLSLAILLLSLAIGLGLYFTKDGNFLFSQQVPLSDVLPEHPWARRLVNLQPVPVVKAIQAKDCGVCHTEIYEEWKASTHANAFSDLQFQSEIAKENNPKWLCLNCHIPIGNQRQELVSYLYDGKIMKPVLEPNPEYIPGFEEEGVTCATCHVEKDNDGNSYILGAKGNTLAKHPVKVDKEKLNNRCMDCHNQTYLLEDRLICYFQTKDELSKSKLHSDKTCANCHMPTLQRKLVEPSHNTPIRTAHRHAFIGGGVPKKMDLIPLQVQYGYKIGVEFSNPEVHFSAKSDSIAVDYSWVWKNIAGHSVTSGDPERHMVLRWMAVDSQGEMLSHWDKKIGQDWEWYPKPKLMFDNRMLPDEARTLKGEFSISKEILEYTDHLKLEVRHVRLSYNTRDYMKKTASGVDPRFRDKVENLELHYPGSRVLYSQIYKRGSQPNIWTSQKPKDLLELNQLPSWEY